VLKVPGGKTIYISSATDSSDPYKYQLDHPSSISWRLKVQNVQVTDEGTYVCQVQIGMQKYAESIRTIRVTGKLSQCIRAIRVTGKLAEIRRVYPHHQGHR
jgi:hypothetical protein